VIFGADYFAKIDVIWSIL